VLAVSGDAVQIANEACGFGSVSPHVAFPGPALIVELTQEPPGLGSMSPHVAFPGPGLVVELVHEPPGLGGVLLYRASAGYVLIAQVPHELTRFNSHSGDRGVSLTVTRYERVS
jgi:hypothetical protein